MLGDDSLLLVEWPERGRSDLPEPDLLIRIAYQAEGRRLDLEAGTDAGRAMLARLS